MPTKGLNRVMVIGNLGQDAVVRYTASGKPVVSFAVAANRVWKDAAGNSHEQTEWFQCVHWRGEKVAPYLVKGKRVYVEGRMQTRSWEDQEGNKKYRTELVVRDLILLGDKAGSGALAAAAPPDMPEPPLTEEIPF